MNYGDKVLDDIHGLIELFRPHCRDRDTIEEIQRMLGNRDSWSKAHDLFSRIRNKTLRAERTGAQQLACQYLFEEICAKTLYNLSGEPAPFDADSPYWIIPNAISFARCAGIEDQDVINVVAA